MTLGVMGRHMRLDSGTWALVFNRVLFPVITLTQFDQRGAKHLHLRQIGGVGGWGGELTLM